MGCTWIDLYSIFICLFGPSIRLMKKIILLLPLILISCIQKFDPEPKLVEALKNESISIRGNLIDMNERVYRLDYYDIYEPDSHYELIVAKGYHGGGPTWLGIIYGAITLSNLELLDQIRFDDEAEGLTIWSQNKSALEQIGRLISVVKSNEKLMDDCINVAKAKWKME